MNNDKIIIVLLLVIVVLLVVGFVLFNPLKADSTISITSASELTEGDQLSISLTDANGAPIAQQNVIIFISGSNGVNDQRTVTTDGAGNAVISLDGLASGQYSVNATFEGNNNFKASHAFQNLNIKQAVTEPAGGNNLLPGDYSIHPGFTPSYREGPLVYGYKGDRFGFVTPPGNFFEM